MVRSTLLDTKAHCLVFVKHLLYIDIYMTDDTTHSISVSSALYAPDSTVVFMSKTKIILGHICTV